MKRFWIGLSLLSAIAAPFIAIRPASAGFFDFLNKVNEVTTTVRTVQGIIQNTREMVNGLNGVMGISDDKERFVKDDAVASAINVYADWNKTLTPLDQELVQYVVSEEAKQKATSYESVSESEWYKSKTKQEQAKISSTYMKLSKLLELAQSDKKRFLGYVFCVQSGEASCQ